jgi:hypothetical protein
MAKKVVASLQKGGGKEHTKVIKMVKSEKSGKRVVYQRLNRCAFPFKASKLGAFFLS